MTESEISGYSVGFTDQRLILQTDEQALVPEPRMTTTA